MKAIQWQTKSGAKAVVEVSCEFELDSQGNRRECGHKEVKISGSMGEAWMGSTIEKGLKGLPAGFPAAIGRLAIPAAIFAEIEDAIALAQKEVAAHNAPIDAAIFETERLISERDKKMSAVGF